MTWPPPSCPCQGTQYAISSVWRGGPRGARTTWSAMKPLPAISPHAPLACCLESTSCSWPLPAEWLSLEGSSCLLSWSGPAFCLPQTCAFHLPFTCVFCLPLTLTRALPSGFAYQAASNHLPFTCSFHNDLGFALCSCTSGSLKSLALHMCL